MPQLAMFKLDQNPQGSGLRCDGGGLFLGRDALLERDRNGKFEARTVTEIQRIFGSAYDEETNWNSRVRSVSLVADALNKGDTARAMMLAVLMRLPDRTDTMCVADMNRVLIKAGFNPDEPRDECGRWTCDGGDDKDDALEHLPAVDHKNIWQLLGAELSDRAKAVLSRAGQAQLDESNAELAAGITEANAIRDWVRALADYLAQPLTDSDGKPIQVPIVNTGDRFTYLAARWARRCTRQMLPSCDRAQMPIGLVLSSISFPSGPWPRGPRSDR